ncbi:MAG: xanthine dehydrogenase family protein subunit M [Deltaproteobacteria bacterium]|nr:xanthine dehydrogenase family protein subunit M [Deltaproteobacteria bacterium]
MAATAFARPATVAEALAALAGGGGRWTPVAGGTDLLVRVRDGARPGGLLDLTGIEALRGIREEAGALRIGALATHAEVAAHEVVRKHAAALAEAATVVGSPAIRNRGTIGGNLANASPAADLVPPLVALGAVVEIAGPDGCREVAAEALATGPGRTVLVPGELIAAARVPLPGPGRTSAFRRLGARRALAIAKVSVAVAATVWRDGALSGVRVALGAVAPTVIRAAAAEAALEGRVPSPDVLAEAEAAVRTDARPITDIRSNETWRREMCAVLLRRAVSALAGAHARSGD